MATRTISFEIPSLVAHFRFRDAVRVLRATWAEANRAAASRRNLARPDDRMLADIGLSAAQAEYEASRWH